MTTTPDRTPADELRAAAKTLLETAAPALEGTEPPVLLADGEWDEWAVYYSRRIDEFLPGDGPWIALMNPLLAEPLAACMEESALIAEHFGPGPDDSPGGYLLAIARVINGGA